MSQKNISSIKIESSPWFKTWFDTNHYHQLYKNRSDQEAAGFIDALLDLLKPKEFSRMIDVGCGAGRHCRQLAQGPYDVLGIDLSLSSIRQAKKSESTTLHFFRHDMRAPYGKNAFDYVFNFFTSFGYFDNRQEHELVISNMANALKPGGTMVMDYINVAHAEAQVCAFEKKEIDGIVYDIERWSDENYFFKRIHIHDQSLDEPVHMEKVAKFRLNDFEEMFGANGLRVDEVYGDYQLNAYDAQHSPRLIMVVKK